MNERADGWDVTVVGRIVRGDPERVCDHLMLALVELGLTDPSVSCTATTGEICIDWFWHDARETL